MTKSVLYTIMFIVQIFWHQIAAAQFFGLIKKNPQQQYWTALSYPHDGKYRVLNCIQWSSQDVGFYKRCQVLVYNNSFQLVDSINLISGVTPIRSEPLKNGNRLYWSGYYCDTINPDPNIQQLVILELDTNYRHIALHKINKPASRLILTTNIVNIADRFFVCQWDILNDTSVIYKLSNQLIKVDSTTYKGAICEMWGINNHLMLSTGGLPSPCFDPLGGSLEKVMLDTVFNLESCYAFVNMGTISNGVGSQNIVIQQNHTALKPLSKTKTVAVGPITLYSLPNPHYCIVNSIVDNNNTIISKSVTCINTITNTSYADGSNILAVKLNEIMTVGCTGYDFQASLYGQPQSTKIFVNKFDTLGNLIWQRQHGGDFFYNPTGIVFTTDGGSLISGWRYVPLQSAQTPALESFLLKLDVNGEYEYVGIKENGSIDKNEVRCFPNPSNDRLYFDIPFQDQTEISIYSSLGEELFNFRNYQNLTPIKIDELSKGVYFYKLLTKTKYYSGKFMKE